MAVVNAKFSTFIDGGELPAGVTIVGLGLDGLNTKWTFPGYIPSGYIVPVANGGTGADNATDARSNLGLAALTNGQLWIGRTGDAPLPATLTAGPGINIVNTSGSITISGGGAGYNWTEVTGTSQSMAVNNGYVANNAALVTLTLPATANIGDTVILQGKGAGLFRIAQNAAQTIHFGNLNSTAGVGGYIEATARYDSIELLCITANTDWAVLTGSQGVFTVV